VGGAGEPDEVQGWWRGEVQELHQMSTKRWGRGQVDKLETPHKGCHFLSSGMQIKIVCFSISLSLSPQRAGADIEAAEPGAGRRRRPERRAKATANEVREILHPQFNMQGVFFPGNGRGDSFGTFRQSQVKFLFAACFVLCQTFRHLYLPTILKQKLAKQKIRTFAKFTKMFWKNPC
jgi:hypothetical protein